MPIKGFIFDFDGLIIDTEVPGCLAWQELFHSEGYTFSYEDWKKAIGTGPTAYDPGEHLSILTNRTLNTKHLHEHASKRSREIILNQKSLPGVFQFIELASQLNIPMAVASSSQRNWVEEHLKRLDLLKYFQVICSAEDVNFVKPAPDLFLLALRKIGLSRSEVIVFEDSPNGIKAAKKAGLYCIAIPNDITRTMDLSLADRVVESFLYLSPTTLINNHL